MSTVHIEQKNYADDSHRRAFYAVAEQLKKPLLVISGQVQTASSLETDEMAAILHATDAGLALIDSLLLSLQLHNTQEPEQALLQPVALGAVLFDAAHMLDAFAKRNNCDFRLELTGKHQPVLANQAVLQTVLVNLGYEFIMARSQSDEPKPVVTLAAHKDRWGMVTGLYSNGPGLSTAVFRRARHLHGKVRQPLPSFTSGNGAGIFVADSLLKTMATNLRVAYYHKQSGLAATLAPSQQLSIV